MLLRLLPLLALLLLGGCNVFSDACGYAIDGYPPLLPPADWSEADQQAFAIHTCLGD